MDSLTQIILGAAVGEVVLGKQIGNKAMLYGAIAGTIPDLDVLARQFTDTTKALEWHRGFTHSVVFSFLFAPLSAWLVIQYEKYKDFKGWMWLFFWAYFTHPLLDAHTTWGTQLFWPLDIRLAFKSIFVIDPLYTLPFLVFLLLAMSRKKMNPKRRTFNRIGLWVSSSYLMLTLVLKFFSYQAFQGALEEQKLHYVEMETRPAPLNTIMWSANVDADSIYLLANYSFFDTQPIAFTPYAKNHHLLDPIKDLERVERMIHISKGWYIVSQEEGQLYFSDLRFGAMSADPTSTDFVFKYKIIPDGNGNVIFEEVPKDRTQGIKLLKDLWERVKGN